MKFSLRSHSPLLVKAFFVLDLCVFFITLSSTLPVYNDLNAYYKGSDELDVDSSLESFLDSIQDLASIIIRNVSRVCPLSKHVNHMEYVHKIVMSTLSEIYEDEDALESMAFYDTGIMSSILMTLATCVRSLPKITEPMIIHGTFPKKIIHLDLNKHYADASKWQNFETCIRTKDKTIFYSNAIPSAVDTLWQSFLLGYFGCKQYYSSPLDAWRYLDVFQTVILLPLLQRWRSTFPTKTPKEILEPSTLHSPKQDFEELPLNTSPKDISTILEKCNVNLFLKYPVDPIPCFRMLSDNDNNI